MANPLNAQEALGDIREDDDITQVDVKMRGDKGLQGRDNLTHGHQPVPHGQPDYEDELSDEEEYAENILKPNRQGYHNVG
ncbi:hypothetical protein DKX38_016967 [Salix brachista]|uniref:Uncharacterized protein n=1 Tax=Salix brachista TaxID=2182728 RepID=A0A5N5KUT6_9ROSI|nr:hypothetical protein DKX38_016967 [Salix brachista]